MKYMTKSFFKLFVFFVFVLASLTTFSQSCICYADRDNDGYGDPNDTYECFLGSCDDQVDWQGNLLYHTVSNSLDCNDNSKDINPLTIWYEDKDGDKFTSGKFIQQCSRPAGYKLKSELYQPVAICGFVINVLDYVDCDDNLFNTANQFSYWFVDNDEDSAVANKNQFIVYCSRPIATPGTNYIGFTHDNLCNVQQDCDDNDALLNPHQEWYLDGDDDGFPLNTSPEYVQCQKPAGPYKAKSQLYYYLLDCDDRNATIHPMTWYEDKDGDGLITGKDTVACIQPQGYIILNGIPFIDCNDNDANATIEQSWYPDTDGDGHGNSGASVFACKGPAGYFTRFQLSSINDCNDNDNKIHPGAMEYCNNIDDNCDGIIDEIFCCPAGNVLYVKANAAGTNNGTSWVNAFKSLQDALQTASKCNAVTQIWVAGGTYYPDEGATVINNNKNYSFNARNNLAIYGGFAGNETQLSERSLNSGNASILSGEIQQDNDKANNSNNIFIADSVNGTFTLDGFTVRDGYTNIILPENKSRGTGILVLNNASPFFKNCIIEYNSGIGGSGITSVNSNPLFYTCVIRNNTTFGGNGAIWNDNSSPGFVNCSIANNSITGSEFIVVKNTGSSSPSFNNCIVRGTLPAISGGTPSVMNSIIQNGSVWPGSNNSNADPLFVNEAGGDLRLTACSPAVNTGSAVILSTDILGLPRVAMGGTDRGAYELQSTDAAARIYVKADAAGANNGTSWLNAFTKFQNALSANCPGAAQIWVAKGTYYPDEGVNKIDNDRTASFTMKNKITIYGGFAGTETILSQRNISQNATILSGEIQQDDDPNNNSYFIFNNPSVDATAVLDGFTISSGTAPTNGGGMNNINSSPNIRNCVFKNNRAASYGGAVYNSGSNPSFTNVLFYNNSAGSGGAMFNTSSSPVLMNCTVANNFSLSGAGFFNQTNSFVNLTNCIVWGNTGGNAISNTSTSPATVNYSVVQGGYAGTGNISADPLFTDTTVKNFALRPCSPAINSGTASGAPATDINETPRPAGLGFDIGVYERPAGRAVYVDAAVAGNADGSSWKNACTSLYTALQMFNGCAVTDSILIAGGTYTVPAGIPLTIDRLNGVILGGYPSGGGARNPVANPVITKGEMTVVKSVKIDGLRLEKQ